jgi:hypothetical protein
LVRKNTKTIAIVIKEVRRIQSGGINAIGIMDRKVRRIRMI